LLEKEMEAVLELFQKNNVQYFLYDHVPVHTSEEASRVRGVELKTGVKAMLVREKETGKFLLADVAADRKLDFRKLEELSGAKLLRFATKEEVLAETGC